MIMESSAELKMACVCQSHTQSTSHNPRTVSCRHNCLRGGGSRLPHVLRPRTVRPPASAHYTHTSPQNLGSSLKPDGDASRCGSSQALTLKDSRKGLPIQTLSVTTGALKAAVRRGHSPSQRIDVHIGAGHNLLQTKGELSQLRKCRKEHGHCARLQLPAPAGSEGLSSLA